MYEYKIVSFCQRRHPRSRAVWGIRIGADVTGYDGPDAATKAGKPHAVGNGHAVLFFHARLTTGGSFAGTIS